MTLQRKFVGIDISGEWLDLWLEPEKRYARFAHAADGLDGLVAVLRSLGPEVATTVAFEATGGCERDLRERLLECGFEVHLVNAAWVRLYARSLGQKAKNDRLDARIIARYAMTADTHPQRLDREREHLAELVSQRQWLVSERVAVTNHGRSQRDEALRAQQREHVAFLDRQIAATEALIRTALGDAPSLAAKVKLMKTLKGVKDITATVLVALLPELGTVTRHAIAALAGVAPFDHDSGTMAGKRAIAGGRAPVRTALYMAARAAALSKSPLGDVYRRHVAAGKAKKVATVALMRKMLVTLNAMLREGTSWKHANAR
jgi:transposase